MTSIAMQPARLMASICTGDGPAVLSPSMMNATRALVALKTRFSDQTNSAASGGFASDTEALYQLARLRPRQDAQRATVCSNPLVAAGAGAFREPKSAENANHPSGSARSM
jgi:hypothetical protein